ncbi:O-antigen ligase family protein [Cardiobacterium sp. AH-315-I02]|nr:O-antigen ligase family protein [Cardiobacterium sp. AH-315-I02]
MKLPTKSANKAVEIQDFYEVKVGSLWRGLKQEHVSFWFLCAYLFFEYIRPQSLYPVIDILPWALLSLLLACVTAISDKTATWVKSPGNGLIIAFFIVILLSSAFAFRPSISWGKIDIFVNWVILYFLFIAVVNTEKRFLLFALLFFLLNFKMSQHGFTSFAARGFAYTSWGVTGSPGWFRNAGDFGIQMTIFVPLAIAFILALQTHWGKYKKLLFYMLPITGLVTVLATSSRGAQLGVVATVLWFIMKSKHLVKTAAILLVLGSATYAVLPDEMLAEYQGMGEDSTSEARLSLWGFGMEVVKDKPFLGVGYENWLAYCRYVNPHGVGKKSYCVDTHNTYVEAASELGVTGFLLFISTILFMFVLNARTRKNVRQSDNRFISYMAHGLDGGLVGSAVASFFFSILFYPMFWVQLAMTVALHQISKKQISNMDAL